MASLKDIRLRIDSVKNTQQITKAMKMVSAAKLRKAQHQIVSLRPYAQALLKAISNIALTQRVHHPLLTPPQSIRKVLLIVISSDRGLCGGFNNNINKFTENYLKVNETSLEKIDLFVVGKKAFEYLTKRKIQILDSMNRLDKDISYNLAAKVADTAMRFYLSGAYEEVRLVYNEFKSAISQKVVCETLLPVDLSLQTLVNDSGDSPFSPDLIFEPEPDKIIDELLTKNFAIQVFRCMAESVAAEHGARMTSMENATNNARDMVSKLTLTYNKIRQEKITTELIEIVSGAEAL